MPRRLIIIGVVFPSQMVDPAVVFIDADAQLITLLPAMIREAFLFWRIGSNSFLYTLVLIIVEESDNLTSYFMQTINNRGRSANHSGRRYFLSSSLHGT